MFLWDGGCILLVNKSPTAVFLDSQRAQFINEEELRLLAIAEACHSEEIAASDLLTNPHQSLIYSEYNRLIEELRAKRLKGYQSRIALRVYQHNMRHETPLN